MKKLITQPSPVPLTKEDVKALKKCKCNTCKCKKIDSYFDSLEDSAKYMQNRIQEQAERTVAANKAHLLRLETQLQELKNR